MAGWISRAMNAMEKSLNARVEQSTPLYVRNGRLARMLFVKLEDLERCEQAAPGYIAGLLRTALARAEAHVRAGYWHADPNRVIALRQALHEEELILKQSREAA